MPFTLYVVSPPNTTSPLDATVTLTAKVLVVVSLNLLDPVLDAMEQPQALSEARS